MKALVWHICLARNNLIFNDSFLHALAIILKIDLMILSWFSAAVEGFRVKFDDSISTIRRSMEFFGQHLEEINSDTRAEEAQDQFMG